MENVRVDLNSMKPKKKLMIIGVGWEQINLIKTAKKMNCYILATSENKNSEGLEFADKFEILNPRDLDKAIKISKKFKPDAIISDACDYSHFATEFLNNYFGYDNSDLNAAQLRTNKYCMREKCKEENILQPRFKLCRNLIECYSALDIINFPII